MTGWILCAPRKGDKDRDQEMKWMTLCYPGNTAETDKWNFLAEDGQLVGPPKYIRHELNYEEGKLLVVNLDRDVPEAEFLRVFGQFGEIVEHKLCENTTNGLRNGKAWVRYRTGREAERAMEELDGLSMNGRSIEVKKGLKKGFTPQDYVHFS